MRWTAIGLLVAATVLLPATPCLACSCVAATAAEVFARADAVFTGVAVEDTPAQFSVDEVEVRFTIEDVHKGPVTGPTVTVFTRNQGSACGIGFVQGARYTVYASESDEGLVTSSCSGTHAGSFAAQPLVWLHPGPIVDGRPASVSNDTPMAAGVVAAGLIAATAAIVRRRRTPG
jgi:hypothetical protein